MLRNSRRDDTRRAPDMANLRRHRCNTFELESAHNYRNRSKESGKAINFTPKSRGRLQFFVYFLETQAREGCARKMTIRRRKCVMETDTRETEMGIDISASVLSRRECKVVKLDVSKLTPREHNDIEAQT